MENCVGVDVSKHQLDWVLGGEGNVARVPNTPAGIRRLVAKLRSLEAALIVVESTGGYERVLTEALSGADLPVALVNPWRVRRFGEGLGELAKTDPIDARILALYGERARPRRRPLPGPRQRQMADLVRRRRQLIAMIVAEKSRLDTASAVIRRDISGSMNGSMRPSQQTPRGRRTGNGCRAHPPSDRAWLAPSSSICPSSERSGAGRSRPSLDWRPLQRTAAERAGKDVFARAARVLERRSTWRP